MIDDLHRKALILFKKFQTSAIDFSRRNSLLKLPSRSTCIDFTIGLDECESFFGPVEDIDLEFNHKKILKDEPEDISNLEGTLGLQNLIDIDKAEGKTVLKGKKLISILEKLRLKSNNNFQEHGLHTLFLVFGEISWKDKNIGRGSSDASDKPDYRSPLFLVPISLETIKYPTKITKLSIDNSLHSFQFNPVLFTYIEQTFDLRLPNISEDSDEILQISYEYIKNILHELKSVFQEVGIDATVKERVFISQFSFHGQQIYEDLKKNENEMLEHEFIKGICGGDPFLSSDSSSIDLYKDDINPDEYLTKEEDYTILDADGSQIEAIRRIMAGNHMVIHGPPGTGKSQTIANVISNFLARKKTVLFVCEKQVALDVVFKRLESEEVNVADLCLPLFNYISDKKTFAKDIIDSRDRIMSTVKINRAIEYDIYFEKRQEKIGLLKEYGKLITSLVLPLNKNLYWVFGKLASVNYSLKKYTVLWGGDPALSYSFEAYERSERLINQISQYSDLFDGLSVWNLVLKKHFNPNYSLQIIDCLSEINQNLKEPPLILLLNKFNSISSFDMLLSFINLGESRIIFEIVFHSEITIECILSNEFKNALSQVDSLRSKWKMLGFSLYEFNFPLNWETVEFPEFKFISENAILIDLLSIKTETLIDKISNIAKRIDKTISKDFLLVKLSDLLSIKPLFTIDLFLIQFITLSRVDLYAIKKQVDRLVQLDLIIQLTSEFVENYKFSVLQEQMILDFEAIVHNKYNNIFRFFSKRYKSIVLEVSSWCTIKKPISYNDVKGVINFQANKIRSRKVYELELGLLISDYDLKKEIQFINTTKISKDLNKVIDYLDIRNLSYVESVFQKAIKSPANKIVLEENITDLESFSYNLNLLNQIFGFAYNDLIIREVFPLTISINLELSSLKRVNKLISPFLNESIIPEDVNSLLGQLLMLNSCVDIINLSKSSKLKDYVSISDYEILIESDLIDTISNYIEKAYKINDFLSPSFKLEPISNLVCLLKDLEVESNYYKNWVDQVSAQFIELSSLFENETAGASYLSLTFSEITSVIYNMTIGLGDLERWIQYISKRILLKELNLEWFLDASSKGILNSNLKDIFISTFFNKWFDEYSSLYPEIRDFSKEKYLEIINEFKTLELKSLVHNRLRILKSSYGDLFESKKIISSEKQFNKEANKKLRHLPIRKLVNKNAKYLQLIKPCWMISPLALSSYLEFGIVDFDVVIFDEASQLKIESAIGAIARAKQVVVIGDQHQLPPSSFFNVAIDDESDDEEQNEELGFESILDIAKSLIPGEGSLLNFHYRSSSEDLIAFSNFHIYNSRLITFPSQLNSQGVSFHFVENGVYDKGGSATNLREAEEVADLCIRHAENFSNKTLGVISFSKRQEQAIRDSLNEKLIRYAHLSDFLDENSGKKNTFFIKSLESVQGDERDNIILSICYGPDKLGAVANNFGPINQESGYRRLNVAVTRAKEKLICVSSMHYFQMRPSEKRGVILLQKFLEYAEKGRTVLDANLIVTNLPLQDHDSEFEACVEAALQDLGYQVHRQIGASGFKIDLAIVDPINKSEYILGIECDGAAFHSTKSARLRDRLRQDILEARGWKFYRIWSQDWYQNQREVLNDIVKCINSLTDIRK